MYIDIYFCSFYIIQHSSILNNSANIATTFFISVERDKGLNFNFFSLYVYIYYTIRNNLYFILILYINYTCLLTYVYLMEDMQELRKINLILLSSAVSLYKQYIIHSFS